MTNPTCSIDGCAKRVHARSYCIGHYSRWRNGLPVDAALKSPYSGALCSIDGCEGLAASRGWCRSHYARWQKHGSTMEDKPLRTKKGESLAFLHRAAAYEGDGCLLWPYSKNDRGYGTVHLPGEGVTYAHRYVLTVSVGPPPFPRADAAHAPLICHNRACVNPKHLRWATREENMADTKLDGTFNQGGRCWARKGY